MSEGKRLRIALLDPFHGGSHAQWSTGLQFHSQHEIVLLTLPGRHWKWRMHGAALTLAEKFLAEPGQFDLVLATDMLDLSVFLTQTRQRTAELPTVLYFHENQLAYPWSPTDADVRLQRDNHYAFINFTSALAADHILFNSPYNRNSMLEALPGFLKMFPDRRGLHRVEEIRKKSELMPLGLELPEGKARSRTELELPRIVWNHRWEYDKGPEEFFQALLSAKAAQIPFELAVLGESYGRVPPIFAEAKAALGDHIRHWGYAKDRAEYLRWLHWGNLLPVTSRHDFFGISVVEAVAAGCTPLLPERLNYPHLISGPDTFYPTSHFSETLHALLQNWPLGYRNLRTEVERYAWSEIGPKMDAFLTAKCRMT